jgi:hypothetical protein
MPSVPSVHHPVRAADQLAETAAVVAVLSKCCRKLQGSPEGNTPLAVHLKTVM